MLRHIQCWLWCEIHVEFLEIKHLITLYPEYLISSNPSREKIRLFFDTYLLVSLQFYCVMIKSFVNAFRGVFTMNMSVTISPGIIFQPCTYETILLIIFMEINVIQQQQKQGCCHRTPILFVAKNYF